MATTNQNGSTGSDSADVVVIGGGPAGLMAAWKAALAGRSVILLEANDRPGGMSASFDVAGQRVDFGSHRLHPTTDPEILADLQSLLGDDLVLRKRNGRIRLLDKWVRFPLQTPDLLRNLPRSFAVGAAVDVAGSPFRRSDGSSFGAEIRAGLGPTVSSAFYEPYAQKLWDSEAGELDADLARRRVSAASPLDIARRLVRAAQPGGATFYYPRLGYGQIAERLAEAAIASGVDLRLSSPMSGVAVSDDGESAEITVGASTIDASMVWSTAPIGVLMRSVTPSVPPEIFESLDSLRHRAMVLVYLVCGQEQYTPFDAHYFPSLDTPIARLSEPKNYRDGPDPPGQTVLCAEIACWEGDDTWTATADDLAATVSESLQSQGLPAPRIIAAERRGLPRVYPVYRRGYQDSLATVEGWVADQRWLVNFGRQGLFVPDNLHHTLAMGVAAAEAFGGSGNFDWERWLASLDEFADHVVED